MIIKIHDLPRDLVCANGICGFCKRHGIDVKDFLRNGISEEQLLLTQDAMAKKIVERIHESG